MIFESTNKPTAAESMAQVRAWQFFKRPAQMLLDAMKWRGEPPVTAGVFQVQIFKFLDLDSNLRPKNCPEGDQVALGRFLTKILAPRVKSLLAEFEVVRGRTSYGDAPEICYRVVEALVAVSASLDYLRLEVPDNSPVVQHISNCNRLVRDGNEEILAVQRKKGALSNVRTFIDRVAATGPVPLLGDIFGLRQDIVPYYLGDGPDFIPRLRSLVAIAHANIWNSAGNSLLLACSGALRDAKKIPPAQQFEALTLLDSAELQVMRVLSAHFRACTDRKIEPTDRAIRALAINADSLRDSHNRISMANFCGNGPVLTALKLSVYTELPEIEQRGLKLSIGPLLKASIVDYEKKIRSRQLISFNPRAIVGLGRFKREEMPCLVRQFAELADSDVVEDVFPPVFKYVAKGDDLSLGASLLAIRLWGERRYSPSGADCSLENTDLVTKLVEALELFKSRDLRDDLLDLRILLALLAKDNPLSTVEAIRGLVGELSTATLKHVVGAFCSSNSDGSELRWLANKISLRQVSTSLEDRIRRAASYHEIEKLFGAS